MIFEFTIPKTEGCENKHNDKDEDDESFDINRDI